MRSSRQGAIPSELGWLIDTLDSYEERLRTLEAPSGEGLSNAVARLQGLVKPATIYRSESPAPITAAVSPFAAFSIPVPGGYTRALVHVTATATLRSNEPLGTGRSLTCAAVIVGASGPFANQVQTVNGQWFGSVSATSAAVVEGLAPGGTVDVHALVSFAGVFAAAGVSVAGSIIFLR